jgi:hypothetical protein
MKRIHVFTSAACNYIPKVRALCESIRRFHPEWTIHLALSDEIPADVDLSTEPFDEIHPLRTLDIPNATAWAFCHSIVELSTAIKPFLLEQLLERDDCAGVIYLDPDTVLFSRLDDVVQSIAHASIALTPHLTEPEQSLTSVMDNEISTLKHGVYNLGFLAVAPTDTGRRFARWWCDRLYHFCRAEIHNGLFTDQRWIDLVPGLFTDVCILRATRLNVAPWNMTTRTVTGRFPDGLVVDGEPLGFYHFTGFDSGAHRIMVHKNAGHQPAVDALIEWYGATIARSDDDPLTLVPWAFSRFADGAPIPAAARFIYRERLDLQRAFPDPFAAGYPRWWAMQGAIEYPALFSEDAETVAAEIRRLSAVLTPGYQAGGYPDSESGPESRSADVVGMARLAKRAWRVLRNEGVAAFMKRVWR